MLICAAVMFGRERGFSICVLSLGVVLISYAVFWQVALMFVDEQHWLCALFPSRLWLQVPMAGLVAVLTVAVVVDLWSFRRDTHSLSDCNR